MEIEFIARYPKEFTKEELKDIDNQAKELMLFDSDLTLAEARKKVTSDDKDQYQYGPWVLDMNEVTDYNMVDADHTRVVKTNGMSLVLKISYDYFKTIKYMTTGLLPLNFMQFPAPPEMKIRRSKK